MDEDPGRIFEPFFFTRPVGQGRGLDLSRPIVSSAATAGGSPCATAPGKGIPFRVTLPLERPPPPQKRRSPVFLDGFDPARPGLRLGFDAAAPPPSGRATRSSVAGWVLNRPAGRRQESGFVIIIWPVSGCASAVGIGIPAGEGVDLSNASARAFRIAG